MGLGGQKLHLQNIVPANKNVCVCLCVTISQALLDTLNSSQMAAHPGPMEAKLGWEGKGSKGLQFPFPGQTQG